ncbi:MAG: formylglycine-generating enzyme family protein [Campylobacteraceae bacterium]|jgi:formylglycine-generating enzyme required for sulfatase activity|nr:formylglycine-generating enzyme family protein [Campylobacteraceae bacterium]
MKHIVKLLTAVLVLEFLVGCGGGGGGSSNPGGGGPNNGSDYNISQENYTLTYENSIGTAFIKVNNGTFLMGVDSSDGWTAPDEMQHAVNITKPFYLGVYEVTKGEWKAIMGANSDPYPAFNNDKYPVTNIKYAQIQEFIDKLNAKEKRTTPDRPKYRLPTEAEWEYVAREEGAKLTAWSFGNDIAKLEQYAQYNKTGTLVFARVGQKDPNSLGFYDIYGNAYEFVSDFYDVNYGLNSAQLASVTDDPQGPVSGTKKVARGGSITTANPADLRSARRVDLDIGDSYPNLGFRLALDAPAP